MWGGRLRSKAPHNYACSIYSLQCELFDILCLVSKYATLETNNYCDKILIYNG